MFYSRYADKLGDICYNIGMYIEFVILDNFVLTYLAGAIATALCHKRANVWRLIASATAGTVVAVFYPLMKIGVTAQIAVKAALWVILSCILFIKTPRPILSALLFLCCTFALGGASYAFGLVIYSSAGGAEEFSRKCPLFIVLGAGTVVYFCARYAIKRMRILRARAPYEYGTDIEVFGKRLTFSAFLDTGNCVFDDKTGLPIVITDCERFMKKLDGESSREFLKNLDRFRQITVRTAAGSSKAYVIKPTKITVYSAAGQHTINAMVGLVGGHSFSADHEMLLNPAAVAEEV